MALQSLTTTPTPSGTETAAPPPGPNDTNANSSLLGPNGPQPLVPAFILSGLLIVGIFMMCWWKRLAARRIISSRIGAGADGVEEDYMVNGGWRGRGTPRINMVIGAGRGMGTGMILLAAHGADLHAAALEGRQQQLDGRDGRRKKEVKLGPRPVLWDVHLETETETEGLDGEKDLERPWRWRDMRPLSASSIYAQTQAPGSKSAATATADNRPSLSLLPSTTRTARADSSSSTDDIKVEPRELQSSTRTQYTSPLRISVLISMPTPPRESARRSESGHTSASEESAASSSSPEALEDTEGRQEARQSLGDLNLVLGITEVPLELDKKKL